MPKHLMFIMDYSFYCIFFIYIIVLLFCSNMLQLLKVKRADNCSIIMYIVFISPLLNRIDILEYIKDRRVFVFLGDWLNYVIIVFFVFFLFVVSMLLSSIWYCGFDGMYLIGNFLLSFYCGIFFKIFCLCLFLLFICVLKYISYCCSYITFEFFFFFLCVVWGIYMVLSVFDFISMYIFIELQGVCFYVLAALFKHNFRTIDAGLKYFIFGSIASSCFLFGLFIIYSFIGVFNMFDAYIFCHLDLKLLMYVALCLIASSFLFKLMVFPFHFWSLDVYEGSSYVVTFFFLVFSKISFFYLIWLFFNVIFIDIFFYVKFLFLFCASGAIIYSTFLCFVQVNIKRFFICSSYNHVGFILGALACNTSVGMWSFFFYICVYMVMTFFIWILLNILYVGKRGSFVYLSDFCGLFNSYFFVALFFVVALFSMAGLPPFVGFFAKLFVIYTLFSSSFIFFGCLFLIFSVVSAFYYIRILKYIFVDGSDRVIAYKNIYESSAIILCSVCWVLSLFIYYSDLVLLVGQFIF